MKFVVSSGDLLSHLQIAGRAIPSKSPVTILENFLFSVEGSLLTITASDMEVVIKTTLEVSDADHDGKVAVPGGKITEYLKKLPEQPITFNIDDTNYSIEIVTSSGNNNQGGLSAEDFPEAKDIDNVKGSLTISTDVLLSGINHTLFAASSDDLRPIMNGVLLDIQPDKLIFVATDSHVLSRYIRTDVKADFESSLVLGRKAANLIKNIFSAGDDVTITYNDTNAVLRSSNHTLICRLAAGNYPNYKSVIPSDNPYHVVVNRQDLSNAVYRSSLFTDGSGLIRLELTENNILVSAQDLTFACSASEKVSCQYDGIEMPVGLKSPSISTILTNMTSTDIEMQFSDPSRAVLILPTEKTDNEDELLLIMPMRV